MTRRNRVRPPTRPGQMPDDRSGGEPEIPTKDDKSDLVERMKARIAGKQE